MKVGVRELKNGLSRYLDMVKNGEHLTVTERGREIAIILPLAEDEERIRLLRLVKEGVLSWNGGKPRGIDPQLRLPGKPLSEIVLEDRGDPLL